MAAAALLFDLDGTLCDSRPWYTDVFVRQHSIDRDYVAGRLSSGCPPVRLADELGITRSRLLRSCHEMRRELRVYGAVPETLSALVARGTPLGLTTSLSGKFARLVLAAHDLRSYFAAVVTAEWGLPPKPSPASLLRTLDAMQLRPSSDIYYIGDMSIDAEAATAAEVSFAWVAYGYGHDRPANATAEIRTFSDVLEL